MRMALLFSQSILENPLIVLIIYACLL